MKSRIYLFDNLKFLLILLVVVGHFAQQYIDTKGFKALFLFIYSFHMPLFIFISGLFYKEKDIKRQIFTYLSFGILLKIFLFITCSLIGYEYEFNIFSDSSIPWFMYAMAGFIFLKYFLRDLNQYFVLCIWFILACFVGFDKNIGDFLFLSRIIVFYPFYLVGTMINVDFLIKLNTNRKLKILSFLAILFWASMCLLYLDSLYFLRPLFTGRNAFSSSIYIFGPLYRILCYFITSIISISLICVVPKTNLGVISMWGTRTLQVYFYHVPIIYLLIEYTKIGMLCNNIYSEFLYLFCGVILTIVLSLKFFSFPIQNILSFSKNC